MVVHITVGNFLIICIMDKPLSKEEIDKIKLDIMPDYKDEEEVTCFWFLCCAFP